MMFLARAQSSKICRFCKRAFLGSNPAVYCCLFCAFWDRVAPPNENGCCLWTGNRNFDGYGTFTFGSKRRYVTEVCLQLHGIEVVKGADKMHSCNIRHCVALEHLSQGTHLQNMKYAAQQGRLGGRPNARPLVR